MPAYDAWVIETDCGDDCNDNDREKIVLPSGFEPELKPREGFMIGRYTTGAGKQRIAMFLIKVS